jgi:RNA polymerase sigma-70 factor, ECF subfamily
MATVSSEAQIAAAWREHRPYLVNLAFRMLGDIGEAEDVVQEAFARLLKARIEDIDDERGWLIVVTSRLCLDRLRSARVRRERPHPNDEVDEVAPGPTRSPDPADRVTLDESVRQALLVVLDRLTPAERVAFVLHDIFQMPFEEVGSTVGRSAAACRQLAKRARQKIEEANGQPGLEMAPPEHRVVAERFIAACTTGDLAGLLEVLDPEVSGGVDLRPGLVVRGADRVAANILYFWGQRATLVDLSSGPRSTLLAYVDRRLAGLLELTMAGGRITKIHVVAEPASLAHIHEELLVRS